ncbi:MAG: RNA polymerase sigma factor [Cellulomonadaceae bacterium]|nr:RNA polymerase sigma factor [Cellulomonadaceae bacterium]
MLDASSDTASDGTDAALATLFTSVYTDLQRYAARRVGFNDAQDLASDTMVTAFERWSDAPPGLDRQRAWTFGILHHKISNFHQASARRTFAVADVPDAIDREEPPDDLISSLDRVRNLLAHLRPAERDTFTLIVEAGLSSAQAAEVLGCSVTAVTTRVSRAKRHLEKILNTIQREEGNDDGNP